MNVKGTLKRLGALLLVLSIVLSIPMVAFAEGPQDVAELDNVSPGDVVVDDGGEVTITEPETEIESEPEAEAEVVPEQPDSEDANNEADDEEAYCECEICDCEDCDVCTEQLDFEGIEMFDNPIGARPTRPNIIEAGRTVVNVSTLAALRSYLSGANGTTPLTVNITSNIAIASPSLQVTHPDVIVQSAGGHLTMNFTGTAITVTGNGTMVLRTRLTRTGTGAGARQGIVVENGGTLILDGATAQIDNFNPAAGLGAPPDGGGVRVTGEGSTLYMLGGRINDNIAPVGGGGVRVMNGARFNMFGGRIDNNNTRGNESNTGGGGVRVDSGGRFYMAPDNTSTFRHSGHVQNWRRDHANFNDVTSSNLAVQGHYAIIENNQIANAPASSGWWGSRDATARTQRGGAGIFVTGAGTEANIFDGNIRNNWLGHSRMTGGATSVDGGTIYEGQRQAAVSYIDGGGGGMHIRAGATVRMSYGMISNNRVTGGGNTSWEQGGGGVQVADQGTQFIMTGGRIASNSRPGWLPNYGDFAWTGTAANMNNINNVTINMGAGAGRGSGTGGGGLYITRGALVVIDGDAEVLDNTARRGGGIAIEGTALAHNATGYGVSTGGGPALPYNGTINGISTWDQTPQSHSRLYIGGNARIAYNRSLEGWHNASGGGIFVGPHGIVTMGRNDDFTHSDSALSFINNFPSPLNSSINHNPVIEFNRISNTVHAQNANGGGVRVTSRGHLIMHEGVVRYNQSIRARDGTFVDGDKYNNANWNANATARRAIGGGIALRSDRDNRAGNLTGGATCNRALLTMTGGEIYGNIAGRGGGLGMNANSTARIYGGTIRNNIATGYPATAEGVVNGGAGGGGIGTFESTIETINQALNRLWIGNDARIYDNIVTGPAAVHVVHTSTNTWGAHEVGPVGQRRTHELVQDANGHITAGPGWRVMPPASVPAGMPMPALAQLRAPGHHLIINDNFFRDHGAYYWNPENPDPFPYPHPQHSGRIVPGGHLTEAGLLNTHVTPGHFHPFNNFDIITARLPVFYPIMGLQPYFEGRRHDPINDSITYSAIWRLAQTGSATRRYGVEPRYDAELRYWRAAPYELIPELSPAPLIGRPRVPVVIRPLQGANTTSTANPLLVNVVEEEHRYIELHWRDAVRTPATLTAVPTDLRVMAGGSTTVTASIGSQFAHLEGIDRVETLPINANGPHYVRGSRQPSGCTLNIDFHNHTTPVHPSNHFLVTGQTPTPILPEHLTTPVIFPAQTITWAPVRGNITGGFANVTITQVNGEIRVTIPDSALVDEYVYIRGTVVGATPAVTYEFRVEVEDSIPHSIVVTPETTDLERGDNVVLRATVVNVNGIPLPRQQDFEVDWVSATTSNVTVAPSRTGASLQNAGPGTTATALITSAVGSTNTVTATLVGDTTITGSAAITITEGTTYRVVVTPDSRTIGQGLSDYFTAEVQNIHGAPMLNQNNFVINWTSSNTANVGLNTNTTAAGTANTVRATVVPTAPVGPNASTITATLAETTLYDTGVVNVTQNTVITYLRLTPTAATVARGGSHNFTPEVLDQFGVPVANQSAFQITWASARACVTVPTGQTTAGVAQPAGVIPTAELNPVVITATIAAGPAGVDLYANATITIVAGEPTDIRVTAVNPANPATPTIHTLANSQSGTFRAEVLNQHGALMPNQDSFVINWTSATPAQVGVLPASNAAGTVNETVATVTPTAPNGASVTITAVLGGSPTVSGAGTVNVVQQTRILTVTNHPNTVTPMPPTGQTPSGPWAMGTPITAPNGQVVTGGLVTGTPITPWEFLGWANAEGTNLAAAPDMTWQEAVDAGHVVPAPTIMPESNLTVIAVWGIDGVIDPIVELRVRVERYVENGPNQPLTTATLQREGVAVTPNVGGYFTLPGMSTNNIGNELRAHAPGYAPNTHRITAANIAAPEQLIVIVLGGDNGYEYVYITTNIVEASNNALIPNSVLTPAARVHTNNNNGTFVVRISGEHVTTNLYGNATGFYQNHHPILYTDLARAAANPIVIALTRSEFNLSLANIPALTHTGQSAVAGGTTLPAFPTTNAVLFGTNVSLTAGGVAENHYFLGWYRVTDRVPQRGDDINNTALFNQSNLIRPAGERPNPHTVPHTFNMPAGNVHYVALWGARDIVGEYAARITFHAYGVGNFGRDASNNPITTVVIPVAFGQNIDLRVIEEYLASEEDAFAFWGWFTHEALDESGRRRANPPLGTGLRRPTVGTFGFEGGFGPTVTAAGFTRALSFTEAQWNLIADNTSNLELHAIWSLWGDVNDDDQVNSDDLRELTWHVGQLSPRPTLNLAAADVHRNGVVNSDDLRELTWYVGQLFPRPVLGQRATPPPSPSEAITPVDNTAEEDNTVYDIPEYEYDTYEYEYVPDEYVAEEYVYEDEEDYSEFYVFYAGIDGIMDEVLNGTGLTDGLLTNEATEAAETIIEEAASAASAAAAAAAAAATNQKLPQTGVEGTMLLWASLMTLSLMLALGAVAEIKKRKDSENA